MADTYSLRGFLLWTGFGSLVFSISAGVYGATDGVVAGLAAFVVLFPLGLVFQRRAERRGIKAQERRRLKEWEDEAAALPRWKRIAWFVALALFVVGVAILKGP